MYGIKTVNTDAEKKLFFQSTWRIEKTVRFREVTICRGAVLTAPEGKYLTLSVNGTGMPIVPGKYYGDVVLSVTEFFPMAPHGLMRFNDISRGLHAAVTVRDGRIVPEQSIPALAVGGSVADGCTEGAYFASEEESFNGIVVAGGGEYTVRGVTVDFDGRGDNDFLGVGAAVAVIDEAHATIEDCNISVNGSTRCAIHVGGDSQVLVRNCSISNHSEPTDFLGQFSWQVDFTGSNRLTQLTDNATVVYDNCRLKTNGWGVCSIDGSDEGVKMTLKDCYLELTGPRAHGYGAFCIGENEITYDHTEANVNGYPFLLMGMEGKGRANVINGSVLRGRRFGAMVVSDDNSVFNIADSRIQSGKSALVVKGSSTILHIRNTEIEPQNGVILQLMDSDECGMNCAEYRIPVGVTDTADPARDLYTASETEDVTLHLSDCSLKGDFYNSTSNIRADENCPQGEMGEFHDTVVGILEFFEADSETPPPSPVEARHNGDNLRGAKNLLLDLKNTRIEGVISSATQKYRDGLTVIRPETRRELSNITQTAAPTVNNGVIVSLDERSAWIVTGESYITALDIAPGAVLEAPEGKRLVVTLDGEEITPAAGSYRGRIRLAAD